KCISLSVYPAFVSYVLSSTTVSTSTFLFIILFFFLMLLRPPRSTLFPYRRSSDLTESARPEDISEEIRGGPAYLLTVLAGQEIRDRKSTRLNSSHQIISYAVFCLKKKNIKPAWMTRTKIEQRTLC